MKDASCASPAPKKSLGQHFLRRPDICRRIADLLDLEEGDQVLEIGPGPGALTDVLQELPHKRLLLLEKDSHWAEFHAGKNTPGTEVRCMDALAFPWEELEGKWKLAGNLPYNVASPMLWDIASRCRSLSQAAFMVQKEVGQRLAAAPGTKDYGALSVWTQAFWVPRMAFIVGPSAFTPPPKVDSAVLSFKPLPEEKLPKAPEALAKVIKLCFSQRRKQLGGVFRKNGREDLLDKLSQLGLPLTVRAEELSVEQFIFLSGAGKGTQK